jgi:hypothetical protein
MSDELEKIRKEAMVAYFKILFLHSLRRNEENREEFITYNNCRHEFVTGHFPNTNHGYYCYAKLCGLTSVLDVAVTTCHKQDTYVYRQSLFCMSSTHYNPLAGSHACHVFETLYNSRHIFKFQN